MDNKMISIAYDSILYFENSAVAPRKVIVYSTDGRYEFYVNLKDIHKTLDDRFIRCHNSFIVNTRHVKEADYNQKELVLTDGSKYPISARKVGELKKIKGLHCPLLQCNKCQ